MSRKGLQKLIFRKQVQKHVTARAIRPLAVLRIRIRMFLVLVDPKPLVKGTDTDPDPSIIKQKMQDKR
jgi:hypothetical protein